VPTDNGGSAITGYQVSSDNGSTWVTASGSTSHTFASLANGTSYDFKVRAVNVIGTGTEASVSAIPGTTPSTPRNFTAIPGNRQVVLSWTAPSNEGTNAITGYQVSSDNGSTWVTASSNTGHTFTGLTNGTRYNFRIRAVNAVGSGAQASTFATPRNYGSVSYEGQIYKTIVIGTQTWMAENLNYNANGSVCYNNDPANCAKYGRLYDWATAMAGSASSTLSPSGVRGICPPNWHIPSDAEWDTLINAVGGSSIAGTELKASSGWDSYPNLTTDTYGFTALPGGLLYSNIFDMVGIQGNWWSASDEFSSSNYAYHRSIGNSGEGVFRGYYYKISLLSVRCVKD
jgi:uncharacterized protein (TIGR02145 family)